MAKVYRRVRLYLPKNLTEEVAGRSVKKYAQKYGDEKIFQYVGEYMDDAVPIPDISAEISPLELGKLGYKKVPKTLSAKFVFDRQGR